MHFSFSSPEWSFELSKAYLLLNGLLIFPAESTLVIFLLERGMNGYLFCPLLSFLSLRLRSAIRVGFVWCWGLAGLFPPVLVSIIFFLGSLLLVSISKCGPVFRPPKDKILFKERSSSDSDRFAGFKLGDLNATLCSWLFWCGTMTKFLGLGIFLSAMDLALVL